jgi:hypothetical protein
MNIQAGLPIQRDLTRERMLHCIVEHLFNVLAILGHREDLRDAEMPFSFSVSSRAQSCKPTSALEDLVKV